MIDKINSSQIQEFLRKLASYQPDSAKALTNNGADVSLHADYAYLISQATHIQNTDTKTIQQAQELLQTGQLESPENIREAAEDIITYGI